MSLNDEIKAITEDSTKSFTTKYFDLVSLLHSENDACNLLGIHYFQRPAYNPQASAPTTQVEASDLHLERMTFGVEIECLRANGVNLCAKLTEAGIINHDTFNHYNHTDSQTSYKYMYDGSVESGNSHHTGCELVSPILNNFETLKKVCKVLNDNDTRVNKTCGLHVHIGCSDLNEEQRVNVFANYFCMQDLINTIFAPSRRANRFCQDLTQNIFSAHTIREIERACRCSRYYKVNYQAIARHNTIEFRGHHGTTNFKKISMWATFCKKLVAWSKDNRLTNVIDRFEDLPFLTSDEVAYFNQRATQLNRN